MDNEKDFPERRGDSGPGRRAEDYIYYQLCRRLERVEDKIEKSAERFELAIDRLETQVDRHKHAVDERVDSLERFHIEESAVVRDRVATRTRRLEKWQVISLAVGIGGVLVGVVATLLAIFN